MFVDLLMTVRTLKTTPISLQSSMTTLAMLVYRMEDKKHVTDYLLKYIESAERKFSGQGLKVHRIRSDNGGEYIKTQLQNYSEANNIYHEFTVPHTQQQNGVSERLNRTLMEKVNCLLQGAQLPPEF